MKKTISILLAIAIVIIVWVALPKSTAKLPLIKKQISENQYTIIVVNKTDESPENLKYSLMQKAAEVTQEHGYRYFVIEKQEAVYVVRTTPNQQPFYGDMYEELIIQRDFGTSSLDKQVPPDTSTCEGLKMTFGCYEEKPVDMKAYDSCSFVECKTP